MNKITVEINFSLVENKNREENNIICTNVPPQVAVGSASADPDSQ
jgi:hypothetical protein